jgi:hypothetical protein
MNRRPNSLRGRVIELERLRHCKGGRQFFMIWGRDEADLAKKLAKVKADGDLLPGDKFDARIWPHESAPPPPRRTALHKVSIEELRTIASSEHSEGRHFPSSIACQWTDVELSDIYANGLPHSV